MPVGKKQEHASMGDEKRISFIDIENKSSVAASRVASSTEVVNKARLTNLQAIVEEKEKLILKQDREIKAMRNRFSETNNEICALANEVSSLKQRLSEKGLQIR